MRRFESATQAGVAASQEPVTSADPPGKTPGDCGASFELFSNLSANPAVLSSLFDVKSCVSAKNQPGNPKFAVEFCGVSGLSKPFSATAGR